jgi:hypothetical protein
MGLYDFCFSIWYHNMLQNSKNQICIQFEFHRTLDICMYLRLTSSRIFTNALYINSEILITEIGVSNEAKNVGVLLLVFLFCQLYFTISHNYFLSLLNRELCLSNNFLFWQNRFLICQINFTLLLNHINTEKRKNTKISNEVRTYSYYQSNERWYSRLPIIRNAREGTCFG